MISEAIKELFKKLKQEDPNTFGWPYVDDFEITYFENKGVLMVSAVEWVNHEPDIKKDLGTLDEMLKKYEIDVPKSSTTVVLNKDEGGITEESMRKIINND